MKLGTNIDWHTLVANGETLNFISKLTFTSEVFSRVMEHVKNKDRMSTQLRLMIDMDSWLDNEFELTLKNK